MKDQQLGIVITILLLIGIVAVYAARQRWNPPEDKPVADKPAEQDDRQRFDAAHVLVCETADGAIDAATVFDNQYHAMENVGGTTRLATAALVDGRRVDVVAVLSWDGQREAWDIVELYAGGVALPVP